MATIASRLTNTGTLLVNGSFDETTFNTASPVIRNLAVYSQNTTGTGWTGYGRAANNPNYDYAPDGTFTASRILESADAVNALHGWGQSQTTYVAGNRYTISFYMKSYSGDRNVMFGVSSSVIGGTASNYVYADANPDTGATGNAITYAPAAQTTSSTYVSNGWYRFSLSFLAANTATSGVDIQIRGGAGRNVQTYIGNGTSGVLFWGLQIEQSSSATIYQGIAAAGTLVTPTFKTKTVIDSIFSTNGFDEVSYSATGAAGAYVYKNGVSTSTNVLAYSQDWSQYQSLTNATITNNNTVAPDGTQTAGTLTSTITGGTNTALIQKWNPTGISTSVLPWCLSLYVKQGNCPSVGLNLAFYNGSTYQDFIITLTWATLAIATTGSIGTGTTGSGVSYVGDGWYRIYCTITNNYSAPGVVGRMYVRGVAGGNVTGDYNYLWGMQIEQASSPTAYVATGATTSVNINNFSKREGSNGLLYTKGEIDEFTGAPVVDSSLQLWLDAGQSNSYSSGTVWKDLSINVYNVNFNSNTSTPPVYNYTPGTFSINKTTQLGFVSASSTLPNIDTSTFSIEAWLNHSSFNAGGEYFNIIAIRESYPTTGFRFGVLTSSGLSTDTTGRPRLWTNQSGGTIITGGTTYPISLNTWYQVTVTYDGTNCLMYINGALYVSTTGTYNPPTGRPLNIGTNNSGCNSMNGQISAFKWYNRALTADEIAQNFNALRRRYGV